MKRSYWIWVLLVLISLLPLINLFRPKVRTEKTRLKQNSISFSDEIIRRFPKGTSIVIINQKMTSEGFTCGLHADNIKNLSKSNGFLECSRTQPATDLVKPGYNWYAKFFFRQGKLETFSTSYKK
jgi:hypothetical protein